MQGRAIEEMEFVAVDAPKATRKVARERARSMMRQQAAFAVGGWNQLGCRACCVGGWVRAKQGRRL